jgi:oxygen-independent coproporphyrinogen III oxidase
LFRPQGFDMSDAVQEKTGLGNYFVANYPPFSFWTPGGLTAAQRALQEPAHPGTPLGLYLHIPFCRKRCKFCYFRVYTDKNARDVETYLDALVHEIELYSRTPVAAGRSLQFVYFGGGTPSFLSASQLRSLCERIHKYFAWDNAEEVTFECEPGTLQQPKLATLKELGVTRLSLGIENFDDKILEANGRAHLSAEILRAYGWARDLGFPQINIDLIAGMVGETWDNWKSCIQKTIELSPDSVTIYQMELPFNTVYSKELRVIGQDQPASFTVADWPTKRAWVDYAFQELAGAGYEVSSAYTMVKNRERCRFVYRDSLWHGADMFGTGVASFGHVSGVHMQNVDSWEDYVSRLEKGELPLNRALPVGPRERLIREMILQLKTGRLDIPYFQRKFGVDIRDEFRKGFDALAADGCLERENGRIELTRKGLLEVDRRLPAFFLPEHLSSRYT